MAMHARPAPSSCWRLLVIITMLRCHGAAELRFQRMHVDPAGLGNRRVVPFSDESRIQEAYQRIWESGCDLHTGPWPGPLMPSQRSARTQSFILYIYPRRARAHQFPLPSCHAARSCGGRIYPYRLRGCADLCGAVQQELPRL